MDELQEKNLQVANILYEYIKVEISDLIKDPTKGDVITFFKIITICASNVEMMLYDDKKLRGSEKKKIVLYLAERFIEDFSPEYMYDTMQTLLQQADVMLEDIIDFAKKNKTIKRVGNIFSCCK